MAKIIKPHLLVVGGTGFIGYHLIAAAKKRGWKVTSVSLNHPKKYRFLDKVKYIKVDISNLNLLKKKLKKSYTYIVNLGGYGIHNSYNDGGKKIIDAHFLGMVNLTKIFTKKKINKFVQIGSSEEYGEIKGPQKENNQGSPTSPYALAKLACTNYLNMLYKINNYPATILRLFLVYGPVQDYNRVLPQVIKGCINNARFPTSKGNQFRDFCYVDDVIKAIFLCLKLRKTNGKIYNIGSGKPQKIKKVINKICKIIGGGKPQFGKKKLIRKENMNLYPNIEKAKSELKWNPKINFDKGLKIVINSYRK